MGVPFETMGNKKPVMIIPPCRSDLVIWIFQSHPQLRFGMTQYRSYISVKSKPGWNYQSKRNKTRFSKKTCFC